MASTLPRRSAAKADMASLSDRLTLIGFALAILLSAWLFWFAIGDLRASAAFAAIFVAAGALIVVSRRPRAISAPASITAEAGRGLLLATIDQAVEPIAITDRSGMLVTANPAFERRFNGLVTPPGLALDDDGHDRLVAAARTAWRDGSAIAERLQASGRLFDARIERAGRMDDHLVWRFSESGAIGEIGQVETFVAGVGGDWLGSAGLMAAVIDADASIVCSNGAFAERALAGKRGECAGRVITDLLTPTANGRLTFVAEGQSAPLLRPIEIPVAEDNFTGAALLLLIDEKPEPLGRTEDIHLHGLLDMLPLGLALVDRDGRFVFMNEAFRRAAGLGLDESVVYPGDLVVKEDKGAVSDAIRRSVGRAKSGDLSVRLRQRAEEPVALTIAAAKGLGEATVLLSLKDNSEESKLMRQVAQATKMQAVGQLAGGVAHDFNNILTAIIGHCDLMMMRHTPGDSDYDDIQQIKHNSNRAASLTRQLLAFSRQQTLRPQILQLPDVISEISNLLKRLLGETVTLEVKHGRNLGAVRADPGQLEQVIVNLAVNARDAMPGGGMLTIQTYSVSAAGVRRLDSDIMPPNDYTALKISDTGTGIPPDVIGKIFEPFFTTKEVGKGTGLGLSTVYGIVKQTDGFIFADSKMGQGTSFVIYLPVHQVEADAQPSLPAPKVRQSESWGTGTVLLVEDEPMVRAVAERALSRQGYTVLTANNGEEALVLLENATDEGDGKIDLLISDVVMPMMDGPTLGRHARERFPNMPILFMSGYAEEQLRNSIDLDRVAFLPKPFSVQQLAEAARDTLANPQQF